MLRRHPEAAQWLEQFPETGDLLVGMGKKLVPIFDEKNFATERDMDDAGVWKTEEQAQKEKNGKKLKADINPVSYWRCARLTGGQLEAREKKQKEEQKREKLHTEALKVCKGILTQLVTTSIKIAKQEAKARKKKCAEEAKAEKKRLAEEAKQENQRLAAEAKRLAAQKPKKAKQKKRPLKKRTRLDLEKLWEREAKRPKRARVAPDYKCKGCTGLWLTWEDNQFSEELGPWQNCETCDFSMCGVCCKAGLLEKHESEHTQ